MGEDHPQPCRLGTLSKWSGILRLKKCSSKNRSKLYRVRNCNYLVDFVKRELGGDGLFTTDQIPANEGDPRVTNVVLASGVRKLHISRRLSWLDCSPSKLKQAMSIYHIAYTRCLFGSWNPRMLQDMREAWT